MDDFSRLTFSTGFQRCGGLCPQVSCMPNLQFRILPRVHSLYGLDPDGRRFPSPGRRNPDEYKWV
jgi:hypothetical protein